MTLPRLAALSRRWRDVPPAAVQLARIAHFLGAAPKEGAPRDPRQQAVAAGVPVASELPDDPHLGFLDDGIGLGQSLNGVKHG